MAAEGAFRAALQDDRVSGVARRPSRAQTLPVHVNIRLLPVAFIDAYEELEAFQYARWGFRVL